VDSRSERCSGVRSGSILPAPENPERRWRAYACDELLQRDKANLDIFWLRDESLESADNLSPPDVIAAEIADGLEAALEQFRAIAEDLAKPIE
jgi:type I restriction enzyme M protein